MMTHIFTWKNNEVRARFYRKPCRIRVRGKKNTILIEFEDGFKMTTSANAVRKLR